VYIANAPRHDRIVISSARSGEFLPVVKRRWRCAKSDESDT
jgi:hypothetical protein